MNTVQNVSKTFQSNFDEQQTTISTAYLSNSAKTPSLNLLGIQLNGALWEVEPLLDDAGQLPDPPALLSQHVLGPGGHDDDLRPGGSHTDLRKLV